MVVCRVSDIRSEVKSSQVIFSLILSPPTPVTDANRARGALRCGAVQAK